MSQAEAIPNPLEQIRQLRREAAAEIERLIAFLDMLGGDPDLQDGGDDEPVLAHPEYFFQTDNERRLGGADDRELDDSDDEETGDEHEPSLGWNEAGDYGWRPTLGFVDAEDDFSDYEEAQT